MSDTIVICLTVIFVVSTIAFLVYTFESKLRKGSYSLENTKNELRARQARQEFERLSPPK